MIRERVGVTSHDPDRDHWFFVYHPDNDWYPKFYHLVSDTPLGDRFCGYTNQIDTVFLSMLEARQRIKEEEDRARIRQQPIRPVKLHLLIPAYQPILIAEAPKIPENIGDFVIEGRINSGVEFVWLNLPREQRHYVEGIGEWIPPTPGWWDWCMSKLGLADEMPMLGEARVLGTRQQVQGGDSEQDVDDSLGGGSDGDDNSSVVVQYESDGERDRHDATPLHQRRRRRHRRHRHRTSEDGRASRREDRPSRLSVHIGSHVCFPGCSNYLPEDGRPVLNEQLVSIYRWLLPDRPSRLSAHIGCRFRFCGLAMSDPSSRAEIERGSWGDIQVAAKVAAFGGPRCSFGTPHR
ncbi:hypothetical protein AUP68_06492 [Ilyonectria robusta]